MKKRANYNRLVQIGNKGNTVLHIIFILYTALCVLPFLMLLGISISSERSLLDYGYRIIPRELSPSAYIFLLNKSTQLLRCYGISIGATVLGTILSVIITLLFAYPLSRKDFRYRNLFSFMIFFSMIFHGGMVATYMVRVQILGLKNNLLVYIVPFLMSSWNVMLMRTFLMTSIPDSLVEAAKIDGAGEFTAFLRIILPLSLPGIATIALLTGIGIWNDWGTPLLYVTDATKFNLQYMMYRSLADVEWMKHNMNAVGGDAMAMLREMPSESARMAMCVVAVGPIVIVYPFLQKYFVKGMVVGAVKG